MKLKLNIGISNNFQKIDDEMYKLLIANNHNIDYIANISILPEQIDNMNNKISNIIKNNNSFNSNICSVPLYESSILNRDILDTLKKHIDLGYKGFTFHLTPFNLLKETIDNNNFRINSRGGMILNNYFDSGLSENPLITHWDKILNILDDNNIKNIFIGTSLRPGNCNDSLYFSKSELSFINLFLNSDVDKFIMEAGGHIKKENVNSYYNYIKEFNLCSMGPIISDGTNGFDNLTAQFGNMLIADNYRLHTALIITKAEHIRIPTAEDTEEAIKHFSVFKHLMNLKNNESSAKLIEEEFTRKHDTCKMDRNIFGLFESDKECNMCGSEENDFCPLRKIK